MKRTTISLPDELAVALERESRRRHAPVSTIAREALTHYLGLSADEPRSLPFAGVGGSGDGTIAENAEELLAEEWDDDLLGR